MFYNIVREFADIVVGYSVTEYRTLWIGHVNWAKPGKVASGSCPIGCGRRWPVPQLTPTKLFIRTWSSFREAREAKAVPKNDFLALLAVLSVLCVTAFHLY